MSIEQQRLNRLPAIPPVPVPARWHNPTKNRVSIPVVVNGVKRAIYFEPGETKDVDPQYDQAIQRVQCSDEDCRRFSYKFCLKGHDGLIVGGLAPMLRKVGGPHLELATGLDANLVERQAADAKLASALVAQRQVDAAIILAAERLTRPEEPEVQEPARPDRAQHDPRAPQEPEAPKAGNANAPTLGGGGKSQK